MKGTFRSTIEGVPLEARELWLPGQCRVAISARLANQSASAAESPPLLFSLHVFSYLEPVRYSCLSLE
mgnify:CR=1 FL=1